MCVLKPSHKHCSISVMSANANVSVTPVVHKDWARFRLSTLQHHRDHLNICKGTRLRKNAERNGLIDATVCDFSDSHPILSILQNTINIL